MSISINKAEKNGMWRGDNAGLDAIHIWIRKEFPKPKFCQNCQKVKPYDLANISQKYYRIISDWKWLCRKCHMLEDGRLSNLIKNNKLKYNKKEKKCIICKKKFLVVKSKFKNHKFCSYECYQKYLGSFYIICKKCKNPHKTIKSRPQKYCSRKCYFADRK